MTSRWRPPEGSNEEMLPVPELCPESKADPVRKRVTSSRSQGFQLDSNYWDTKLFNMTWKENKASQSWRGTRNLRVRKGFGNHGVQTPPCADEGSVAKSPREYPGHGTHLHLWSLEWPRACLSGHTLSSSFLWADCVLFCFHAEGGHSAVPNSFLFLPTALWPTNQTTSSPQAQSTTSVWAFKWTLPAHPLPAMVFLPWEACQTSAQIFKAWPYICLALPSGAALTSLVLPIHVVACHGCHWFLIISFLICGPYTVPPPPITWPSPPLP